MLLLQTIKRAGTPAGEREELTTYATSLPLPEALQALREYEAVHNRFYRSSGMSIEHRLIGVQSLADELGADDLAHARMFRIEDLLRDLAAIDARMSSAGSA